MLTFQRYSNSDLAAAMKAGRDSEMADVEDTGQHAHAHAAEDDDETDEQLSPEEAVKQLLAGETTAALTVHLEPAALDSRGH